MNPINMLIVAISFYLLISFEKNKLINLFIIFFIFLENSVLTFAIYKNIILLIICFIILYNFKKKISLTIFCLILAWVFSGQIIKVDLRKFNQNYGEIAEINEIFNLERMSNVNSRSVVLRLTEPIGL